MENIGKRILCAALAVGLCAGAAAEAGLTGERVLRVEQQLYALGYHGETCDSQLDEGTRRALRSFQTANGLEQTGEPDAATLALLDGGTYITCREYLMNLANSYFNQPILQAGSSGDAVVWMQQTLRELGYFEAACDGVYGDETVAAVRLFQMAHGLEQSGTADRATQLRLYEGSPLSWDVFVQSACAGVGDSGVHVRRLQRWLENRGYFHGECTGTYGDFTQRAVTKFQEGNMLEATGMADAATCDLLYSDLGAALKATQALHKGDSSDSVAQLQSRLSMLGYFDRNITGFFGATTETAVRLFQMANELPSTGEADEATLARLTDESAVPMESVRGSFREMLLRQDETGQMLIGNAAMRMRGQAFEADDEDLFEGFAFVQYVCAASGIPVLTPDDVISLINTPVEDVMQPQAGELLAFRTEDAEGVRIMLAVSSGEGRIIYATAQSGWVLEGCLNNMEGTDCYRWDMTAYGE